MAPIHSSKFLISRLHHVRLTAPSTRVALRRPLASKLVPPCGIQRLCASANAATASRVHTRQVATSTPARFALDLV
jgi:hypothetical protein